MKQVIMCTAVLLSFLVSCKNGNNDIVNIVIDRAKVSSTEIYLQKVSSSEAILSPQHMIVAGGHLVIIQSRTEEHFVVYDLPLTGEATFAGKAGHGPGEFVHPDVRSAFATVDGFNILEQGGILKDIAINEDNSVSVKTSKQIILTGEPQNGVIVLNDKYINQNVNRPDQQFEFVCHSDNNDDVFFSSFPNWGVDDGNMPGLTYSKLSRPNPSKDIFVAFYSKFPRMRIFSSGGTIVKDVKVNTELAREEGDMRYSAYSATPSVSDDRIVALFSNSISGEDEVTPELQIWDWHGSLRYRLSLDVPVSLFTVDFSNGMLYALDRDDENSIYTYNISKYLKK